MDSETLQGKQVVLLVATRKGAWLYQADSGRNHWRVDGPHFLGHIINHLVLDPRDGRTLLAAASTGHLGPTIFRSHDLGKTWLEAARPPAFGPAVNGLPARSVAHTFWLAPGPDDERDMWYAGTSPQGLFRSEDGGANWAPFSVINDDPQYREWMGSVQDGTPDGPKLHSIIIDPRDARHIYFAMSGGGCTSPSMAATVLRPGRRHGGRRRLRHHDDNLPRSALRAPVPKQPRPSLPAEPLRHLPARLALAPLAAHRPGMPAEVGDIGFPMVLHPRNDDTAWVFPMDGTDVWPCTSPGGKPAVHCTRDGGDTWHRHDSGMPREQAWWTVKRQAMCADTEPQIGLYFGTTSGELWASRDEGRQWQCIARHLPEIYAVEAASMG